MKCEWEFQFETRDFRFDREYRFKAISDRPINWNGHDGDNFDPYIRITPSDRIPPPEALQVGSLFIELPLGQKETKDAALFLAKIVIDRIRFTQGDFRINWGLIICKHIPETAEEEETLGEGVYGITLNLVEVSPTSPTFDPSLLEKSPSSTAHIPLISQFNEAERDKNPITKFLGFYRIIESATHTSVESSNAKTLLKSSPRFKQAYEKVIARPNLEADVDALVSTRHRCAHLKLSKGFGYTPVDPAVHNEVKPLIALARAIARELITSGS